MKRFLLLSLILLGSQQLLRATEYFDITNYKVDIQLFKAGYFDVVETIDVEFSEKRHGIFRTLPYRYAVESKFDAQNGSFQNGDRLIHYELISVPGFNHVVEDDGNYKRIRIGSADTWVSGKQRYIIKYRVWGAFNSFRTHEEFAWNIVGTEWETTVSQVEFNINIEGKPALTDTDMIVFTGPLGSKAQQAKYTYNNGLVKGKSTASLDEREGLTFSMKLPTDFFANTNVPIEKLATYYYIDQHKAKIIVKKDASIEVEERFKVVPNGALGSFTRSLPSKIASPSDPYNYYVTEAFVEVLPAAKTSFKARLNGMGQNQSFDIKFDDYQKEPFELVLKYKVWGAIHPSKQGHSAAFELLKTSLPEPVRNSELRIEFEPGLQPGKSYTQSNTKPEPRFKFSESPQQLNYKSQNPLETALGYTINFEIKGQVNYSKVPIEVYIYHYNIIHSSTSIKIEHGAKVVAKQSLEVESLSGDASNPYSYFTPIAFKHLPRYSAFTQEMPPHQVSDYNILSSHKKVLISNEHLGEGGYAYTQIYRYGERLSWSTFDPSPARFEYSCTYDGLLSKNSHGWNIYFPISLELNDPCRHHEFELLVPQGLQLDPNKIELLLCHGNKVVDTISLKFQGNRCYATLHDRLINKHTLVLKASLPKGIAGPSFSIWVKLVQLRYKWLLVPIWVGLPLFLLWWFFGRDSRDTIVVQYQAPDSVTPAEAGLLWDDKLHKKDLLALLYFWAGKGFIKIQEIPGEEEGEKDYHLFKLKDLPENAKPFEKTMFSGLFKPKAKNVKISALRDVYYTSITKASDELEAYGAQHNFYVPNTRGFGAILRFSAWSIWVLAAFFLVVNTYFDYQPFKFDFAFGFGLAGALCYIFGLIMPKKGHLGTQHYNALLGFREFIRTAEADRLKTLLNDNPRYFEETISYAIVFGLGDAWAKKFEGLLSIPPSFYEGYSSSNYSNTAFMQHALQALHHMGRDMTYITRSVNSTSGGQSWYSGGGSGLGSGGGFSGGGGSSFGGGGGSGGGFGGGGGGSW